MPRINRRKVLGSLAAALAASPLCSHAAVIQGELPWMPQRNPLPPHIGGGWHYFTREEAAAVEALVDRLIPPDPETPGGKDAGCAVFIDRQLAGAYGRSESLYRSGPFHEGTKEQGAQAEATPAQQYRKALAALDQHCRQQFNGAAFWKMIGFPGARYDYRDWVERHNERYPHPPIGLADHPDWKE